MASTGNIHVISDGHYNFAQVWDDRKADYALHRAGAYEDSFLALVEGDQQGVPFCFDKRLSFRPGEVTVLGGINGHGKSLFCGQIALQLISQGQSVSILSFEMKPNRTLYRMSRQVMGRYPGKNDVKQAVDWLHSMSPNLVIMNAQGAVNASLVLGATYVSQRDFDCSVVIIDNLAKVVAGEDDYTGQKVFVQALTDLARDTGLHIILVHHVRKANKEEEAIGKFSFKGSSAIIDQVDNAILIQRNLEKEHKREDGRLSYTDDQDEADVILRVVKQRNGDWTGSLPLWFEPQSTTYCKTATRIPVLSFEDKK